MARTTKKGLLIEEYNLSSQDFFEYKKDGQTLTLVRRAGIEKIANRLGIVFFGLTINAIQLANEPVFIAVINAKKRLDEDGDPSGLKLWSDPVNTSASSAPSNCIHDRYIEIAESRVKDRAILQLAELHELHVHSVGASREFGVEERKRFSKNKEKTVDKKVEKPKSAFEEVEEIAKQISTDIISTDLRSRRRRKKNNEDLLK